MMGIPVRFHRGGYTVDALARSEHYHAPNVAAVETGFVGMSSACSLWPHGAVSEIV